MAPPAKEPKTMSSRLLTMKFMQRSAAKPTNTPSTPSTPAGPPSKRQRLSTGSSFPATTSSDYEAVRAALAAEELKRAQAIERQAAEAGETRWVLSFRDLEESGEGKGRGPALKVVSAGFAVIDAVGDGELSKEEEGVGRTVGGRRRFGKVEKPQDLASSSESSDSDSELSEDNDYDPDDPTTGLIRASRREAAAQAHADRKAKKRAAKAEAAKLAEARRRKEVNLNKVSSISSGRGLSGRSGGGGGGGVANIECHKCGKKGHMMRDCPQRGGGNRRGKRRMSGD